MLNLKVEELAALVRNRKISSVELVRLHLARIEEVNPSLNAAVVVLAADAIGQAEAADKKLQAGDAVGPLHGVPFSVKDSIDVRGVRSTAGTVGFRNAPPARADATLVARLRAAGAIPIAKTNLPDLLFSFETDNLIFGRTNNPYDLARTPGGSSGGESALIAAGGSPLGLGSDCLGSVRVPAAFCGITSIKPTSGRLPRTGHVPAAGLWIEHFWQIGPMARYVDDLRLAMEILSGEDAHDWTSPPVPLLKQPARRIAFFTDNGIAPCGKAVTDAVHKCARALQDSGLEVEEAKPEGLNRCYEIEMGILGADGGEGIASYLKSIGSTEVHPLLKNFTDRFIPYRGSAGALAKRWAEWDAFRSNVAAFFGKFDAILCPVYPGTALSHGASMLDDNFLGFSYTMPWSVAGTPAATVRCAEENGLPVNVQIVANRWRDLTALDVAANVEQQFGGFKSPTR